MKPGETFQSLSSLLNDTVQRLQASSSLLNPLKKSTSETPASFPRISRLSPVPSLLHTRSKSQDTALTCLHQGISLFRSNVPLILHDKYDRSSPDIGLIQSRIEALEGRQKDWRHHWAVLERVYDRRCELALERGWEWVEKEELIRSVKDLNRFMKERTRGLGKEVNGRLGAMQELIQRSIPEEYARIAAKEQFATREQVTDMAQKVQFTLPYEISDCGRVWTSVMAGLGSLLRSKIASKCEDLAQESSQTMHQTAILRCQKAAPVLISAKLAAERHKLDTDAHLSKLNLILLPSRNTSFPAQMVNIDRSLNAFVGKIKVVETVFSEFQLRIDSLEALKRPANSAFSTSLRKARLLASLQKLQHQSRLRNRPRLHPAK